MSHTQPSTFTKTRSDRAIEAYSRFVQRWRWPVIFFCTLVAVAFASGMKKITFKNDYRYFFSKANPQLQDFEAFQNVYTKNDNVMFVVAPEDENVFQPTVLEAVEWLTAEAWKLPFAIRVDSISNFQHTEAEEDDLVVADLVENGAAMVPSDLQRVASVALAEPILRNRLVNDRRHVTGVNVTVELPGKDPKEATVVMADARELRSRFQEKFPGIDVPISGMVPLSNAFFEAAQADMSGLVRIMYLAIAVTLGLLLRSLAATIASVIVIGFSTVTALGITGSLGIPITPPSSTAPTMILTLAVADSVHILVTFFRELSRGLDKRQAMTESLRLNMQPVFLTSLTTCIGFLSMNFSDAPPFRDLGNITAMGVVAAFVYSVLLLPAIIDVLPVKVRVRRATQGVYLSRLAELVIRRRAGFLWGSVAVVAVLLVCVFNNELNDEFVKYFDERIEFRTDSDFMQDNLTGIHQIEYSLGAGESSGINDPAYLARVEQFATFWEAYPGVSHVNSIVPVMKRLNKNLHGDDPAMYKLPESRDLAAQYLLLYEMSLPYGLDLNSQINVDKSATRLTVTFTSPSSAEVRAAAEAGSTWLQENTPASMHAGGVSTSVMFSYISGRNIRAMLVGTSLALVLISFILVFALRSLKYGLVSLVPNLVPAALAFGIWGLLVGQVGVALSVVTAMSLGIVVDDTVHFLSKYVRARRELQQSVEDSVRHAFSSVGTALLVTSAVLVVGFLVLSLSPFELNRGMGKLTAIVIVLALAADFLLLPALLLTLGSKRQVDSNVEPDAVAVPTAS